MTARIKFGPKHSERQSSSLPHVVTDIYRVAFEDIDSKGYLMLKCTKRSRVDFKSGESFLVDKAKLVLNPRNELVLVSTSLTVLTKETEDSFEVDSLELSQKQLDERMIDFSNELAEGDQVRPSYITVDQDDEVPYLTSTKQI